MDNKKWDARFLDLAQHVAEWSKDPSRKTGCVITKRKRIVSLGYNGFPSGVEDSEERLNNRPLKLQLMIHAERNAIHNTDDDLTGATLYTVLSPCCECAKSIANAGIKRVVYKVKLDQPRDSVYHTDVTDLIFAESGVQLIKHEDTL